MKSFVFQKEFASLKVENSVQSGSKRQKSIDGKLDRKNKWAAGESWVFESEKRRKSYKML